jgi:hypothetical protein
MERRGVRRDDLKENKGVLTNDETSSYVVSVGVQTDNRLSR